MGNHHGGGGEAGFLEKFPGLDGLRGFFVFCGIEDDFGVYGEGEAFVGFGFAEEGLEVGVVSFLGRVRG
jgi:hypothetical protein